MTNQEIAIKLENVSKSFDKIPVVSHLNMEIRKEEFISILGPSGCGKTTILKLIAGLEDVDAGSIGFYGEVVSNTKFTLAPDKRKIGMVFQDYALFPHLSVEENIAFGLRGGLKKNRDKVFEMIELMQLQNKQKQMPYKLSGGEQQRVAVARALAPEPNVILLDESFGSLDAKLRLQIREMIYNIFRTKKVTAVLVTHDQSEAFSFSDKVFLMRDGKFLQNGPPREIYENPASNWVASFVGETNILSYEGKGSCFESIVEGDVKQKANEQIIIRPEDIIMEKNELEFNGVISRIQYLGDKEFIFVQMQDGCVMKVRMDKNHQFSKAQKVKLTAKKYYTFAASSLE
jgi:ABC-type Fe3+/spermidine/putrescine transport system ATPase subunit